MGSEMCIRDRPNEPATKARTRFRSHPLHTRSQLVAVRVTLLVTRKPFFDATMSEPASVIHSVAVVLAAASVRGWGRVVVIRIGIGSSVLRAWNSPKSKVPTVLCV